MNAAERIVKAVTGDPYFEDWEELEWLSTPELITCASSALNEPLELLKRAQAELVRLDPNSDTLAGIKRYLKGN